MDHSCITQRQEAKANIFQIMSHLVGNHAVADVTSLATAGDKVYFRPSLFYQEVREFHIVDSGLEFKMDFETDVNHARFPNTVSTISTFDECMIPTADATSQTIIDILRNNDMGMKAKRILKVLEGKAHGDAMNKGGI